MWSLGGARCQTGTVRLRQEQGFEPSGLPDQGPLLQSSRNAAQPSTSRGRARQCLCPGKFEILLVFQRASGTTSRKKVEVPGQSNSDCLLAASPNKMPAVCSMCGLVRSQVLYILSLEASCMVRALRKSAGGTSLSSWHRALCFLIRQELSSTHMREALV